MHLPVVSFNLVDARFYVGSYKYLIAMLKHHASWLADKLRGRRLESVDILLGGDHGSGTFRMIAIVFFRFADGSTTKIPFFVAKIA
jgi:hypothetical protein